MSEENQVEQQEEVAQYQSAAPTLFPGDPGTKLVLHTHGPLTGSLVTMPEADADQAISEGWAQDPYVRPDQDPGYTQEESEQVNEKAAIGVAKLRGEPAPVAPPPEEEGQAQQGQEGQERRSTRRNRASTPSPDAGGGYITRDSTAE